MKDYIVVNAKTRTLISEHDTSQKAWTAWQETWIPLENYSDRMAVKYGKRENMLKYLTTAKLSILKTKEGNEYHILS